MSWVFLTVVILVVGFACLVGLCEWMVKRLFVPGDTTNRPPPFNRDG
jgi:hypothetical protein